MGSDKIETQIRTHTPYHLARLYEIASLESEPGLCVIGLIELYEHILRYLGLVGLSEYPRLWIERSASGNRQGGFRSSQPGALVSVGAGAGCCLEPGEFSIAHTTS